MKNARIFGLASLIALFVLGGLASCSKDAKNRNAEDSLAAYIQENKNIVGFGHVNAMTILEKMEYQKIPQVNDILGEVLKQWDKGFDLKKPLYFAVEAPFDQDGNPAKLVVFINVKNAEEVKKAILDMQYALEKDGEIQYFQENDVTFGFRGNLFALIIKGGTYDGKAVLRETFKQAEGEMATGKTHDILAKEGDVIAGVNLERLLLTSNTELNAIQPDKKKELESLVADAFVATELNFNAGEIRLQTTNLFSNELKARLPFEDNNGQTLFNKLGTGNAWFGLAYNFNMHKAEAFLNDFLPKAKEKMNKQLPPVIKLSLLSLGNNPYSKLFSGQLGVVATGTPEMNMGMELNLNAFLGLGQKGDLITNLLREQLAGESAQGDTYQMGEYNLELKKEGIFVKAGQSNASKLNVPPFAKDFATKSLSGFVDFSKMNMESFELEDAAKVVEILDYATLSADKDGLVFVITAKNKQQNILKVAADYYVKELMNRM